MTGHSIFILSAPVHSGKTTLLRSWIKNRTDISGILTPVLNGNRYFMNAATGEMFSMEAQAGERKILQVGKYIFSLAAFNQAGKILYDASEKENGWLIIDELGPLELREAGFCEVVKSILKIQDRKYNIILVIRDSLLNDVVKYFGIKKYGIFEG